MVSSTRDNCKPGFEPWTGGFPSCDCECSGEADRNLLIEVREVLDELKAAAPALDRQTNTDGKAVIDDRQAQAHAINLLIEGK